MSGEYRQLADTVRKIATKVVERTSPPVERYRVAKRKPLTLEAFGSEDRLIDGQDDFDVHRQIRIRARVDDTVTVHTDRHGDKVVSGLVHPAGQPELSDAFVPYKIPAGGRFTVPQYAQATFRLPIDIEAGSALDVEGVLMEV